MGQSAPLSAGSVTAASNQTSWFNNRLAMHCDCSADICRVMLWSLASASRIWRVQKLNKVVLGLQFLLCISESANKIFSHIHKKLWRTKTG